MRGQKLLSFIGIGTMLALLFASIPVSVIYADHPDGAPHTDEASGPGTNGDDDTGFQGALGVDNTGGAAGSVGGSCAPECNQHGAEMHWAMGGTGSTGGTGTNGSSTGNTGSTGSTGTNGSSAATGGSQASVPEIPTGDNPPGALGSNTPSGGGNQFSAETGGSGTSNGTSVRDDTESSSARDNCCVNGVVESRMTTVPTNGNVAVESQMATGNGTSGATRPGGNGTGGNNQFRAENGLNNQTPAGNNQNIAVENRMGTDSGQASRDTGGVIDSTITQPSGDAAAAPISDQRQTAEAPRAAGSGQVGGVSGAAPSQLPAAGDAFAMTLVPLAGLGATALGALLRRRTR